MSKKIISDHQHEGILDDETLQILGGTPRPLVIADDKMKTMRTRMMARIDQECQSEPAPLVTVRSDEGTWVEIFPKIEKKILHLDKETDTESYLLRLQSGAEIPSHLHEQDEHCLMLEGDIQFGETKFVAGDYLLAPKGSQHSVASTISGALLFIQTGVNTNIFQSA